ncbi:hypothetical protein FOZ63_007844 [Perkinsus olseni]|uniref:Uncharacterized protein n=2 Tax=Perkinsus olseni TaxID=32597 RepID=A0A7J6QA77_PEROL|nr:hypothetical protein FOZ63_007844 [Perkinsus olseni]
MPFDPLSGLSVIGIAKAGLVPLKLACAGGGPSYSPSTAETASSSKAGAATAAVAPQGQSVIDSGHDHEFWWQATHEGKGLTPEQWQHPEAMGITAEDVPVSAVPNPYAMTTKPTGSLWGPWHSSSPPTGQQGLNANADMKHLMQQANELKADLMKHPALANPMKMYQDMAAELKAHYPEFGTFIPKESSFLNSPAASLFLTYNGGAPTDFIGTVPADGGGSISSVLRNTAGAISGFCRDYARSWMAMPTVVTEIIV